ncbi:MAG TPA: 50S ribosomal protein L22 [Patescibacteria group bacterium]|nr:50S ribosomal protein L22 [Patescibacteria group bacterium]
MEVKAITNQTRISPRKVRLVADSIRDLSLEQALASLMVTRQRGAKVLEKTLRSAIANAEHNGKLERNKLKITRIIVNEGPALKRYHASTRGRIHPYKRRSSNVEIILEEVKN